MDGINHQAQDETQPGRIRRTINMNVDAYSDHGMTAYHVANTHGHQETADLLITAGANPLLFMLPCLVPNCNESCKVKHDCEQVHPATT
jgi:hypothetical protein